MSTLSHAVTKLNLHGNKFAITVDDVFTKDECQHLIDLSETNRYEPALVNVGFGKQALLADVRNNDRWIHDDPNMAAGFFSKLKPYIPESYGKMQVSCLNERLRFLRYKPKQYFKPHEDGEYTRDDNSETSRITVQIYLNDDNLLGGETRFIGPFRDTVVYPKTGRVLIFQHDILHEGSPVISGKKYIIRTDVMYRKPLKASRVK